MVAKRGNGSRHTLTSPEWGCKQTERKILILIQQNNEEIDLQAMTAYSGCCYQALYSTPACDPPWSDPDGLFFLVCFGSILCAIVWCRMLDSMDLPWSDTAGVFLHVDVLRISKIYSRIGHAQLTAEFISFFPWVVPLYRDDSLQQKHIWCDQTWFRHNCACARNVFLLSLPPPSRQIKNTQKGTYAWMWIPIKNAFIF